MEDQNIDTLQLETSYFDLRFHKSCETLYRIALKTQIP